MVNNTVQYFTEYETFRPLISECFAAKEFDRYLV